MKIEINKETKMVQLFINDEVALRRSDINPETFEEIDIVRELAVLVINSLDILNQTEVKTESEMNELNTLRKYMKAIRTYVKDENERISYLNIDEFTEEENEKTKYILQEINETIDAIQYFNSNIGD